MPELAKYHTFNTVIIGAGVTLRWRGDTGASPFPPVALRNDGRKNKCTPRGGFWGYPPRLFFRAESTYKPPQPLGEYPTGAYPPKHTRTAAMREDVVYHTRIYSPQPRIRAIT